MQILFRELLVPIVWLANKAIRPLIMTGLEKNLSNLAFSEEAVKAIATFSLPRRILAPFCIVTHLSILMPVMEELIFRYLLQDLVLKELFPTFLGKYNSNAVEFWKSKKGKCIRLSLSISAFALGHLINSQKYPLLILPLSIVASVLPLSIVASVLQEKCGIGAAIGIHCANNIAGSMKLLPHLFRLYFPK